MKTPFNNEAWLIRFLRPCKYYPESSRDLIKQYYSFKKKHSNIYENLTPIKEKNVFDHNVITVLPNRDQHGRRVLILELGKKWKHNKCSLDEIYKACVLFLEAAMLEPITQIAGAVVIFDMDGLTLQQTWQFTPPFAKRIVDLLQDAMPLRIKNIHIINQPYVFNMVFALFKPFLKEKLKNRVSLNICIYTYQFFVRDILIAQNLISINILFVMLIYCVSHLFTYISLQCFFSSDNLSRY